VNEFHSETGFLQNNVYTEQLKVILFKLMIFIILPGTKKQEI